MKGTPKRAAKRRQTESQMLLGIHLAELGFAPVAEYSFLADLKGEGVARQFRFDWADLGARIAWECCGGAYTGGHRHGKAIELDYEKLNLAQLHGWRCLFFTNRQILTGEAKQFMAGWRRT